MTVGSVVFCTPVSQRMHELGVYISPGFFFFFFLTVWHGHFLSVVLSAHHCAGLGMQTNKLMGWGSHSVLDSTNPSPHSHRLVGQNVTVHEKTRYTFFFFFFFSES